MKKKGQFYLIAILLIISLVIGVVTIKNVLVVNKQVSINSIDEEIIYERSKVLEYITKEDLSANEIDSILENFSREYINFLGDNKNTFFIYGNRSEVKFLGNRISEEEIKYNAGGTDTILSEEEGFFEKSITPSSSTLTIYFGEEVSTFNLNSGQNIYYLIKYNYNNEVYIVYG